MKRLLQDAFMAFKHSGWPLGAKVVVTFARDVELPGTIQKHDGTYGFECSVSFEPQLVQGRYCQVVPFRSIRFVDPSCRWKLPWYWRKPHGPFPRKRGAR